MDPNACLEKISNLLRSPFEVEVPEKDGVVSAVLGGEHYKGQEDVKFSDLRTADPSEVGKAGAEEDNTSELLWACDDLRGWLNGGGYEPHWHLHLVAARYYALFCAANVALPGDCR